MMKVLLIYLGRRGAGPVISKRLTAALSACAETSLILSSFNENGAFWTGLERVYFIDTFRTGFDAFASLASRSFIAPIMRKIEAVGPDIIHFPMLHPWSPAIIAAVLKKIPVISTVHDPVAHKGEKNLSLLFLDGLSIKRSSGLIVHADYFTETVSKRAGTGAPVFSIPLGTLSDPACPVIFRDPSGQIKNILFLGRLERYKGIDLLISAFKKLKAKYPGICLTIAGEGDIRPYSAAASSSQDIKFENKWLSGREISGLLSKADMLVAPYISATQSGILPMAYEAGVPVVVSSSGALPEQAGFGKYARIFQSGSSDSLADAMNELIENEEICSEQVKNAKNYSERDINWDRIAGLHMNAYNSVIGTGSRG